MRVTVADRIYSVLFLCTGNSARSILAESLLNHWGHGKFRGFSAGSYPKGQVHPLAIDLIKRMNLPAEKLRSKSWDEFAAAAFRKALKELEARIKLFTSLSISSLDRMTLQSKLREIGKTPTEPGM